MVGVSAKPGTTWEATILYAVSRAHEATPGFYSVALVRHGPKVAIEVRVEPTRDPETGEFLDRPYRPVPYLNGIPQTGEDMDAILGLVVLDGEPITKARHDYLVADAEWCRQNAPHEPAANPWRSIRKPKAVKPQPVQKADLRAQRSIF